MVIDAIVLMIHTFLHKNPQIDASTMLDISFDQGTRGGAFWASEIIRQIHQTTPQVWSIHDDSHGKVKIAAMTLITFNNSP